jgi:hypothetical protein
VLQPFLLSCGKCERIAAQSSGAIMPNILALIVVRHCYRHVLSTKSSAVGWR